jgi:hypothetical protein
MWSVSDKGDSRNAPWVLNVSFPWYCIMEYYFDIACIPLFEILFQNILSIWFFISIIYYPNCINIACKQFFFFFIDIKKGYDYKIQLLKSERLVLCSIPTASNIYDELNYLTLGKKIFKRTPNAFIITWTELTS